MSAAATDMGSVGQADPTSAQPVSAPSLLTSMNPFSGISSAVSTLGSSVLSNWALVAVGVILAVGALLISQKQTVVQVASTAARVAA